MEKLQISLLLEQQLIEMSGDLLWSLDPGTLQVRWANLLCLEEIGLKSGQDFRKFLPTGTDQGNDQLEWALASTKDHPIWEGILDLQDPRTQQDFHLHFKMIRAQISNEDRIICSAIDLRKKTLWDQQLLQQAKLASLSEMVTCLAQEITNPLSLIVGKVQSLESDCAKQKLDIPALPNELIHIRQTAYRMNKMIKALKACCQNTEDSSKDKVFVGHLVDHAIDFCEGHLRQHSIQVLKKINPNLIVEVNSSEITQVLIHLINNAIHAIADQPPAWIQLEAKKTDNVVCISVTDSGHGILPEVANHMMRPFFTTKKRSSNAGLGLAISETLLKKHGGQLRLNPKAKHTSFILEIPHFQAKKELDL